MAKPRKWLRHAGNGSDSLATDSGSRDRRTDILCSILNFVYPQSTPRFRARLMMRLPDHRNDHEPLIAHPGSYDADRCIHRNDHGQPRGRITPAGKQAAVLAVVVTIAKGYDLGYIWKTQDRVRRSAPPAGTTLTPRRPANHPAAGGDPAPRPSASPPARPSTANLTTRSTGRPTRAPAPDSAGPAAATRRSPTISPGSKRPSRTPPPNGSSNSNAKPPGPPGSPPPTTT